MLNIPKNTLHPMSEPPCVSGAYALSKFFFFEKISPQVLLKPKLLFSQSIMVFFSCLFLVIIILENLFFFY